MESYDRFTKCIFEWERFLLKLIGHDVLEGELRQTPMTFVTYGIILTVIVMEFYTFIYYGTLEKIFALSAFSLTVQAMVKLYNVRHTYELQYTMQFLQHLYEVHITTKSTARKEYFRKFSLFTEILFKFLIFIYVSSVFLFFVFPIYVYFTQNELIPPIPLYMPGIDEKSVTGFTILIIFQALIIITAVVGLLAADYYYAVAIISSLIFEKTMSWEMDQINIDMLEKNARLVSGRIRNILQMHQEVLEYLECVDKITFQSYFAQVGGSSVCAVILTYAVLTMKYLPFYGLLAGILIEIFLACALGNFIELTSDRIYASALDLKWNEMPLKEQYLYSFFIVRGQNPKLLTVGGFAPLNMNTCVMIFGRIYNITMIIYSMV